MSDNGHIFVERKNNLQTDKKNFRLTKNHVPTNLFDFSGRVNELINDEL